MQAASSISGNAVLVWLCDKVVSLIPGDPYYLAFYCTVHLAKNLALTWDPKSVTGGPGALSLWVFSFFARQVKSRSTGRSTAGRWKRPRPLGATNTDIIFDVYIREAFHRIGSGLTVT